MNNVLLGVIALVIFRILFKKFGTLTKEEYNKREEAIQNFVKQRGCALPTCHSKIKKIKEVGKFSLKQIKKEDAVVVEEEKKEGFDEVLFLKSVESAVSSIIDAFNNKNLVELEHFCAKNMFEIFKRNIESSAQKKRKLQNRHSQLFGKSNS
jgi:predicted lipid-binding transport protein (Tim44 family)